jgi:transposase-like protein
LWRAVDDERDVLDMIVQYRRDPTAALKRLRRPILSQRMTPHEAVTDWLKSPDRRPSAGAPEIRTGAALCIDAGYRYRELRGESVIVS